MRPVRRANNLTTFIYRLSSNLGASNSWNPLGLSRPVMGLFYLFQSFFSLCTESCFLHAGKRIAEAGRSTYKACFSSVKQDAEQISNTAHVLSEQCVHIIETKCVVNYAKYSFRTPPPFLFLQTRPAEEASTGFEVLSTLLTPTFGNSETRGGTASCFLPIKLLTLPRRH